MEGCHSPKRLLHNISPSNAAQAFTDSTGEVSRTSKTKLVMTVFVSWSGDVSKVLAEGFPRFLKGILPFTKPFFSPGIESGTRWSEKIDRALRESSYAIVLPTSDNLSSPWLHFEAGSVSKTIARARKGTRTRQPKVVPIRFDVAEDQMSGPLKAFQSREWSRDGH